MEYYIYKNPSLTANPYSISNFFPNPTRVRYLYIDCLGRGYEGYGIAYKSELILGHSGEVVSLNREIQKETCLFISEILSWKPIDNFLNDKNDTNAKFIKSKTKSKDVDEMKIEDEYFIDLDEIIKAIIL